MSSIPDQDSQETISKPNSSSSRGHIVGLSCEASGLLAPDQLHCPSLERERNATAVANHAEHDIGTPSSASSAPSKPNMIREAKDARSKLSHRETRWKCVGMIIGFLFAALLSALGHYLLVQNLDGKLTDTSYLTQSQVSAVSILLTTIFKAALTASIGICFAQHLWFILGGDATSLSTIEKMFAFRTNILALGHLRSIQRAPLLFLMALLVWCLGLATVYPPGALIVVSEAHTFTENYNMSVMNPPVPKDLDLAGNATFPTLLNNNAGLMTMEDLEANSSSPRHRTFVYGEPKGSLVNIAQSVITSNQVFGLRAHPGENSTFHLRFRGPQLRCTVSRRSGSIPLEYTTRGDDKHHDDMMSGLVFTSRWNSNSLFYSVTQHQIKNYTVQRSPRNITSCEASVETTKQSCKAISVLYAVEFTFPRGIRTVQHSLSDIRSLPKQNDIFDNDWIPGIGLAIPPEPQALEDWHQRILAAIPISNEWALLDALGSVLTGNFYEESPRLASDNCRKRNNSNNDTEIQDCWDWGRMQVVHPANYSAPLKGTVFDTDRFQNDAEGSYFDPRTALNITEDLLNDVLTNLTLSAISLGTWWDMVPVTTVRYLNTYSFANPINLVVPYSVCLAAATIFAVIAIWSLWQNGIPAADGGFLQIMMATRGNTEMERLVLRERLLAVDRLSEELESLKIRYGELVAEGIEGGRLGFGTIEETVSLRKRKRGFEQL